MFTCSGNYQMKKVNSPETHSVENKMVFTKIVLDYYQKKQLFFLSIIRNFNETLIRNLMCDMKEDSEFLFISLESN